MANLEIVNLEHNIAFLTFEKYQRLEIVDQNYLGYIRYGENNDYPNFLINLLNKNAEHGAIVNSKAAYLMGKSIKAVNVEQQNVVDDNKYANKKQTWKAIDERCGLDLETFDASYLEVITDLTGKPIAYYHLPYANCRLSRCGTVLSYSDNWEQIGMYPIKEILIYASGKVGSFFIPFKFYKPSINTISNLYSTPSYISGIIDIATDTEISTFNYSYIANGFSGATIFTFFNGEPTEPVKKEIKRKLKSTLTGPEKAGEIVINYANKDGKAVEITSVNIDDLDKKFEVISKRLQQKILIAHRVTNPELFGIKTEGQLGQRVSLRESFELMLNTYTKPRQQKWISFREELLELKTGFKVELEVEQLDPIGFDLTQDTDLTQDERRAVKGYEPMTIVEGSSSKVLDALNGLSPLVANKVLESMTKDEIRALATLAPETAPVLGADGLPVPIEAAAAVNDTLTNLTGRQFQGLMRIVSKYDAGKINEAMAVTMMVQGFGLTNEDALAFLEKNDAVPETQTKLSIAPDKVLLALSKCGKPDNDDEVLFTNEVAFKNSLEVLKFEANVKKLYYADPLSISVTDLASGILNAIKGNPTSTIDQIAKTLGIHKDQVNSGIEGLLNKNLVDKNANGFDPTSKAYDKETKPLNITEIYTVYKYALKKPIIPLAPGGTSRDFCKDLISKGSVYEFEDIDKLSNEFGMNLWDYRGGFLTRANGEIDPFCRHIWEAITKIKRS